MRKGIVQAGKFIAFFIVGVLLLWLAFRNINFSKLAADLKEADYSWILLSVFCGFIAYVARARRWALLIHPLGYRPSLLITFYALMTGYLANLALPRIGEITRCVALGKKAKIPVDQLIGTVVVERTIDFFSLMLVLLLLIVTSSDQITIFLKESIFVPIQEKLLKWFDSAWILWLVIFVVMVAGFILLVKYRKKLRKIRFFAKLFDVTRGIINGLKTITNLRRKWEFVLLTLVIWINYALMTWVVVFSIPSTSMLTFRDSIFLLVIGGLAMSAPVQSGLGAFHYIISRGLLFVKGIPLEDGLVYALLTHESQLIFVAIVGTISFFVIFRKHPEEEKEQDIG